MPPKYALTVRKLLQRLSSYGVIIRTGAGKGSETVLVRPTNPTVPTKGPQYTIKHHRDSDEISGHIISAILRRFSINPNEFWSQDTYDKS